MHLFGQIRGGTLGLSRNLGAVRGVSAGGCVTGVEGRGGRAERESRLDDEIGLEQLVGCGPKKQDHLGLWR
jgi:hypothetical protein